MDKMFAPGSSASALAAPGGSAGSAPRWLPSQEDFPPIDEHITPVESFPDVEIVQGERIIAMGADAPHADPHSRLDYVLSAHVAPGYVASSDLKSRFALKSNFAPDASIRKEGTDPRTQRRYLEDLAFEVVSTQRLTGKGGVTPKAEDMLRRGVRRVFGIFVKEGEVKEWRGAWQTVRGKIEDPCLHTEVPVAALLDAAAADDAVAQALIVKNVPAVRKREEQVRAEETRQAVHELCEVLGIPVTVARHQQVAAMDLAELQALRQHIRQHRCWPR